MTTIIEAALEYLRLGLCIIPIRNRTKKPALQSWKAYQSRRPTVDDLHRWFGNNGKHALAVVLGPVSGNLVCRDFDDMASYEAWALKHPDLAATLPTVITFRGRHVYFRADIELVRRHSPTGGGSIKVGDGELRGEGAYVVLPPSPHPDGVEYRWLVPLPQGEIPMLDPLTVGLVLPLGARHRVDRVHRVTEAIGSVDSVRSVNSVPSVDSVASVDSVHSENSVDSVAYNEDLPEPIQRAILESLPEAIGQRNNMLLRLARALKAIPSLADAPAKALKPIVRRWHQLARPVIGTQPFDDSWFDFAHAWPNVRFPLGSEPMALIFAKAVESEPPPEALEYEQAALRLLVSLCRELQRSAGDGPFYLSCRTAGRLIGVNYKTAASWLAGLAGDEVVEVVSRGDQKTMKASRYRYLGEI